MEFRQLEAFVSIVREGNFTQAANKLNLTQPSLSARIQQLEQSLGGKLFTRKTRPIRLTSAGETFLPYAERILTILHAAQEALKIAQSGLVGQLKIGCPTSIATYLMPEIVNRFSHAFEHAELYIETSHSADLVQKLLDGVLDVVFTAVFPHLIRDTDILLRLHDELIVAVPPGHQLAQKRIVPVSELWNYRVILPGWGSAFETYINSLREMASAPKSMVRIPLAAALPMTQDTATITFMPRRVAEASGLVEVQVPDITYPWHVALITRPGRKLTQLEESFVETVKNIDLESRQAS